MLDRVRVLGEDLEDLTSPIKYRTNLYEVEFSKNIGLFEGDVDDWRDSGWAPYGLNNSTLTALITELTIHT